MHSLKGQTPFSICAEYSNRRICVGEELLIDLLFVDDEGRLAVLLLKLVDATGCIDELHFARIKWVAPTRYLELDQWVFLSVFPDDGLITGRRRARQKGIPTRDIFEDDQSIIFGMNVFFHTSCAILSTQRYENFYIPLG